MFKSKNLLILTSEYPDSENKVIGDPFVKSQVDLLAKYFKNVYVISVRPYFPQFLSKLLKFNLPNLKNYSYNNIKVYYPKIFDFPVDYFRKRRGDRYFKVVDKLIKKKIIKFDLIHSHFSFPSGYVGMKLKEKYGKPLVITIHENRNGFLEEYDSKNPKLIYSWKNADVLIRVNKIDLPLLKNVNNNSVCIPNGFDKKKFYPLNKEVCRDKLNLPKNKKIIFSLSNLIERKGYKYSIESISRVIKKKKDILYLIGGSGPLKDKLQKQIVDSNLQDGVRLVGSIPDDKLNLWMNACDLFVLPSLSESFGIVQIEAMACGKPVVATKNGGSEGIITSEDYGLLCEPANPKELAENILVALNKNWDEEYILNYAKQFTWEKIAKEIIRVYKDVMEDET